jgi:hypothetical protein
MTTMELTAATEFGKRVDGAIARMAPFGPEAQQEVHAAWRPLEHDLAALTKEREGIRTSADLTAGGKAKALEAVEKKAAALAEKVAAHEKRVARILEDLKSAEAMAAAGIEKDPRGGYTKSKAPERTTELLMLEREIRDRLQGMKPHDVRQLYLRAVDGSDPALVSAVENAPRAFQLVDENTLALARETKIKASPWAPAIEKMRLSHAAEGWLVQMAFRELGIRRPAVE